MNSWLSVGSKVVCINADPLVNVSLIRNSGHRPNLHEGLPLNLGEVYTIESVKAHAILDVVCIRLVEIASRGPDMTGDDPGFDSRRFRPLITKTQEQDIEMFLRLASPSPLERLDLLAERMNELAED